MIRKLRIKFVAINMAIFTLMLTLLLNSVIFFTREQIGNQNIRMMQDLPIMQSEGHPAGLSAAGRPYFFMRLSPAGERISVTGNYYDLSDETFLDEMLDKASAAQSLTGVLEADHLRYCFVTSPHSRFLVFSDVSAEMSALDHLTHACILLGTLAVFAFLAVFVWLSGWVVRPIEESMAQERRFVADASHELKTPLTVLLANAQILQRHPSAAVQARCTDGIVIMARQMQDLVEHLLDLARIDADASPAPLVPTDLSSLTEDAMLPFDPTFYEKGLRLDAQIEPGLTVRGDAKQLRQLLEILLDNAQKYSLPRGQTTVRLQRSPRNRCSLTVTNPCPPLREDELSHLFQRFYRTDQARTRDGSFGLGLSIAEGIVTRHHGRIRASCQDGNITFTAEFPLL